MKKILSLLMVFALVLSVAACGKKEDKKADQPTEQPAQEKPAEDKKDAEAPVAEDTPFAKAPGTEMPAEEIVAKEDVKRLDAQTLNLIEVSNIPSLVTWLATDAVSFGILGNINSGLFVNDVNGAPVRDLVDRYKVSEDGLIYTFLLKDAKWVTHEGKEYAPVTAQDFVFTMKKLLDPKEASQYTFMVTTAGIKNGKEAVELSEAIVNHESAVAKLNNMKEADFKDNEKETAKEQFDKAKAAAEEAVKKSEEEFVSKYGSVEKAKEEVYQLIDGIGVRALDEKTVQYELANPVPYFTSLMSFPSFFPANQKFVEEKGDKYGSSVDNFLYNGAYIFKEWKLSERHLLEKNELFWDAANTEIKTVDYRVIEGANNDTVVNMYLKDELDSAVLSGENVAKYGNRPDVVSREDVVLFYVEMNQGKGEPSTNKALLANPKARKALNMAVNKKYITDEILGNGSLPADYLVPKGLQASSGHGGKDFREVAQDLFGGLDGYNQYNVEEAKKLWAEAKAETGIQSAELELLIFQGDVATSVGTHLKNEWEKSLEGLKVIPKPLPFSEKIARANRGDYELNFAGWGPDYPDAMTFVDLFVTGGGHNSTNYSNKAYDDVIESAKSGALTAPSAIKERLEKLAEMEKVIIGDDQVVLPLYQRAAIGMRNPQIEGWKVQSFGPDLIFRWVYKANLE